MQTDSLFYRLFQNWPELALNMLQLPYVADDYQFISEEIKQTSFRIDGIFKPMDTAAELPIIFAEVQYQPDQDFYGRFFSEIMLYLYRQKPGRTWLTLAIYPDRATEKPPSIEYTHLLNLPQLHRVYLEDYQHMNEPGNAMLKLIACSPEETMLQAQTLSKQHDKLSPQMLEFIETVLVYKLPQLSREEIRAMLGLNVKIKETRFYQEIAEEIAEEKRREGLLAGETQILIRQLSKRFGPLPTWVQQQFAQANIEQLERWSDRILDAKTLSEVFD